MKDAPKFGVNEDSEICDFIDKYISCNIPKEDGQLKELVLLFQQHKHSSYCKRNKTCRFNFPQPPTSKTLIAAPDSDSSVIANAQIILAKVRKVLADGHTNLSLDEVLTKATIGSHEYMKALEIFSKGNVVILKREPHECSIKNYNGAVMLAWKANMDLQYVLNAYACIMYVASYIMKTDRAIGELLKRVASEARTKELKAQFLLKYISVIVIKLAQSFLSQIIMKPAKEKRWDI